MADNRYVRACAAAMNDILEASGHEQGGTDS
jgi:hypothetical protein